MKFRWMQRPVMVPPMHEHTPLDLARYGEYPRFINPVGWAALPTEWVKLYEDGCEVKPGEPHACAPSST